MPIRGFSAVTGLFCSLTAQSDFDSVSSTRSDFDSPLRADATLSMPVASEVRDKLSMRNPAPSAVHAKTATQKQTAKPREPISGRRQIGQPSTQKRFAGPCGADGMGFKRGLVNAAPEASCERKKKRG